MNSAPASKGPPAGARAVLFGIAVMRVLSMQSRDLAAFDLGEHQRVVLLSVPEGSDKPAKYPATFRSADLVLLTKTDLLPCFDFKLEEATAAIRLLKPGMPVLPLAAEKGEGMDAWIDYLCNLAPR